MPITNADRRAIRDIFRKTKREITPELAKLQEPMHPEMPQIIFAQNTLRFALEVVLNESTPYGEYFLAELATRMAAYTISAAPIERHEFLAKLVAGSIQTALAEKMNRDMAIKTEWTSDGGMLIPNVPEPGKTH